MDRQGLELAEHRARLGTPFAGAPAPKLGIQTNGRPSLESLPRPDAPFAGHKEGLGAPRYPSPLHLSAGPAPAPARPGGVDRAFCNATAPGDRGDKEAGLLRLQRRYALLLRCARSLARAADEADLLDAFCRGLVEVGGYLHAWVGGGSDPFTGHVAVKAQAGDGDWPLLMAVIRNAAGRYHPDPCRIAILTGRPVVILAIEAERETPAWNGDRGRGGSGSMIALPLEADGRSLGHIGAFSAAADTFDDEEVALLTELTADLAFAIEYARARAAASQGLRRLREKIEQTERRRIAATLHDGVAQSLQAVNLGLKRLRVLVAEEQPSTAVALDQLITEVGDAIGEVREVSQELRPRFLERLDLHEAIALHCSELEQRAEIRIPCLIDPAPGPIDDRVKVQCFLGFREALGNALKHANATRIDVTLTREEPGHITICIADNGQGFDIPRASNRPLGLGLAMIAERAEGVGGRAEIQSLPGKGTRVRITAPFSGKAIPSCP